MLSKLLSLLAKWLWIRELGLMNGLAIIISIYVHEYGHYFMAEDLGLKPKAPRFFPFLGAYVQHDNAYDDKKQFKVAFAGPLLGGIFGIVCFYIDLIFHIKFVHQLAIISLLLNLSNLIPYAILDGGQIAKTLGFHNFRLIVIGVIMYYAFRYKEYILVLVGVIGLLGYIFPNEKKPTPMNKESKEFGIFVYVVSVLILGVHSYLIMKR